MVKKRWLNYFIVQYRDEVLIQQRIEKDIWKELYQFVLIETKKSYKKEQLELMFLEQYNFSNYDIADEWKTTQALSHQSICFHFFIVELKRKKKVENYQWMKLSHLRQLAF